MPTTSMTRSNNNKRTTAIAFGTTVYEGGKIGENKTKTMTTLTLPGIESELKELEDLMKDLDKRGVLKIITLLDLHFATQKTTLLRVFESIDTDKSHKIGSKELYQILSTFDGANVTLFDCEKALKGMDSDGNNELEIDELEAILRLFRRYKVLNTNDDSGMEAKATQYLKGVEKNIFKERNFNKPAHIKIMKMKKAKKLKKSKLKASELMKLEDFMVEMEENGVLRAIAILDKYIYHHKTTIKLMFDTIDTDKNNVIDAKELLQMLQQFGIKISKKECSQMIKFLDKDSSGAISIDELNHILKSYRRFNVLNKDDDGLEETANNYTKGVDMNIFRERNFLKSEEQQKIRDKKKLTRQDLLKEKEEEFAKIEELMRKADQIGALKPIAILNHYLIKERQTMNRLFEIIDSDNTGSVDTHEVKEMLIQFKIPFTKKDARALIRFLDKDNSKSIEIHELDGIIRTYRRYCILNKNDTGMEAKANSYLTDIETNIFATSNFNKGKSRYIHTDDGTTNRKGKKKLKDVKVFKGYKIKQKKIDQDILHNPMKAMTSNKYTIIRRRQSELEKLKQFMKLAFEANALNLIALLEDYLQEKKWTVSALFQQIDVDNSGNISSTELLEMIQQAKLAVLNIDDCEALIKFIDKDGSGQIEVNELDYVIRLFRRFKVLQNYIDKHPEEEFLADMWDDTRVPKIPQKKFKIVLPKSLQAFEEARKKMELEEQGIVPEEDNEAANKEKIEENVEQKKTEQLEEEKHVYETQNKAIRNENLFGSFKDFCTTCGMTPIKGWIYLCKETGERFCSLCQANPWLCDNTDPETAVIIDKTWVKYEYSKAAPQPVNIPDLTPHINGERLPDMKYLHPASEKEELLFCQYCGVNFYASLNNSRVCRHHTKSYLSFGIEGKYDQGWQCCKESSADHPGCEISPHSDKVRCIHNDGDLHVEAKIQTNIDADNENHFKSLQAEKLKLITEENAKPSRCIFKAHIHTFKYIIDLIEYLGDPVYIKLIANEWKSSKFQYHDFFFYAHPHIFSARVVADKIYDELGCIQGFNWSIANLEHMQEIITQKNTNVPGFYSIYYEGNSAAGQKITDMCRVAYCKIKYHNNHSGILGSSITCKQDITIQGGRYRGIARFCGEVKFQPGIWVGIEISNDNGACDGSVDGVRYFTCQENRGIFVPLQACLKSFARLNDPVFLRFRDMAHPALGNVTKHRPLLVKTTTPRPNTAAF